MLSVGDSCPRLESVRRGKPLQPTPAGDGLRPAGARECEHPPAVGPGGNASLAAIRKDALPTRSGLKPSPCRRRGTALAVDEVSMGKRPRYCKSSPRNIKPAGRNPSPPRKWVPTASRQRGVGWRGLPLRTDSRRGQRLPTAKRHSPAPRVSASIRFAVRSLSKAMDRETIKSGACLGTSSTANEIGRASCRERV